MLTTQNNPWVKDFPILAADENGNRLVYLDSAATTQHPQQVLDAVLHYYQKDNANPHRGVYELAMRATDAHEGARHRVARFFGAEVRCRPRCRRGQQPRPQPPGASPWRCRSG